MPKRIAEALTPKSVQAIKPPAKGDIEKWDVVQGFGVRVYSTGRKAWIVKRRVGGKFRRAVIGPVDEIPLAKARELAVAKLAELGGADSEGSDSYQTGTFAELAQEYIEREVPKLVRGREVQAMMERELIPGLGHKQLTELRRRDAVKILDGFDDRPGAGYKAQEVIQRLGNFAVKRGLLDASPFVGLDVIKKPARRERVLHEEELLAVWKAADACGHPFEQLVKLLILTGQRLREVADMTWSEIDLDARLWTIPAERTKSRREHTLPLSRPAVRVLEAMQELPAYEKGDHIFSTTDGARPVSGFANMKQKLDRLSGVKDWRLHDLRRTMRTGLSKLRIPPHIAEMILNHAHGDALVRTYDKHSYEEEMAEALEAWARQVELLGRGISVVRPA